MTARPDTQLAFLGCGAVTRKHGKLLRSFEGVQCSFASRDGERAERYRSELGGQRAFGAYEAAFADDTIDTVFVATPPHVHLALTLAALRAGKHVIVEKPPFLNSADFAGVRAAAAVAGRRVFVAENYYYKPLLATLRQLLLDGVIGEPLLLILNAIKNQTVDGWRNERAIGGGGALFEGGIHWVNFAGSLGLTLRDVRGFRPGGNAGLERTMMLALAYEEGAVGSLYYSWEVPSLFKGLRLSRIWGREGSIAFESNGLFVLVRGRRKRVIFPGFRDISGYAGMFRDFFQSIRNDQPPAFDLDAAERDLRWVERAYETASAPAREDNE